MNCMAFLYISLFYCCKWCLSKGTQKWTLTSHERPTWMFRPRFSAWKAKWNYRVATYMDQIPDCPKLRLFSTLSGVNVSFTEKPVFWYLFLLLASIKMISFEMLLDNLQPLECGIGLWWLGDWRRCVCKVGCHLFYFLYFERWIHTFSEF